MSFGIIEIITLLLGMTGFGLQANPKAPTADQALQYAVGDADVAVHLDVASIVFGAIGVLVGLWWLSTAPHTRLVLSRSKGELRISRYGCFGWRVRRWPATDIAAVRVLDRKDDEDKDVFQIQVVLRSGEAEAASRFWTLGRDTMECARRLSEALNVPIVTSS